MKKLYVIGIGPGGKGGMTLDALNAVAACETLVGYPVYLDLLGDLADGKKRLSTPMRQEVERCRIALREAASGRATGVVCSGDAGVYGMAGLIYELCETDACAFGEVEILVVPGVTAALSGAAVLGAPLMNDFAVVSLSDLLTPWEMIEARLDGAARGGFAICLYNPSSRKRAGHLKRAAQILLRHLPPGTLCGYVRNIGRDGESSGVLTLEALQDYEADMFTTVFVGCADTVNIRGKLVTKRGYTAPPEGKGAEGEAHG